MSSKPKIELFKGDSWEECAVFILAIREAAWSEGRLRDPGWMADLASLYFSSRALSWHAKLPLDVRQDWFRLEESLVDFWAPANNPQIQPAPAAAPKQVGADGRDSVLHGVLKAVPDGLGSKPSFLTSGTGTCTLSEDRGSALHVRFSSRSKHRLLECDSGSICSWLAIHWRDVKPDFSGGSGNWAAPAIVSSDNLRSSASLGGPWQLMWCTVSSTGEVTPVWKQMDNSEGIPLCVFLGSNCVWLVVDPEVYSRQAHRHERARLVFEPID